MESGFAVGVFGLLATLVTMVIALVVFFIRMEGRQERIINLLDRVASRSSKEHADLLSAINGVASSMAEEHKEMLKLSARERELLTEAIAIIKSHVADERAARNK